MDIAETSLRARLSVIDSERATAIAAADAAIATKQGALAAAGSEHDAAIAGAEENYQAAQTTYDSFLTLTSTKLADAQTAVDQIIVDNPTIGTVADITITTGGTPDCAAADIEAAVNAALAEIRQIRDDIVAALTNGNPAVIKDALQNLKDTGQAFRDPLPSASDNEAEKQANYATLDGMYP